MLKLLRNEFPDVDVTTSTQFSPLLAEALSKEQIDVAVLRREKGWPDLAYETLPLRSRELLGRDAPLKYSGRGATWCIAQSA